ncbi:aspartic proteinase 36-like [Mangifera indica]|uniref:aspartic proteinase 36-like n=1 Tax=Mangifera indica TaxID=29780 RepID=UPI001CF96A18|nr:aspartic proteinase 36-like [Mangifera indica]
MGLRRGPAAVVLAVVLLVACGGVGVSGNYVFNVESKFKLGGKERSLSALKKHDSLRHGRFLASVDLPLGGNGHPSETGLYFTKIGLGTPSREFYVQVDTGSDLLWVNCVGCSRCPRKSDLGIKLTLFDPEKSKTFGEVDCDDNFCVEQYNGQLSGCKPGVQCQYSVTYGDGSATTGAFVKDVVSLQQASGNFKTSSLNASIIFGCGARQTGDLGSSSEAAVDGILGFGQANSSLFSQLAAAGKVRKEFAHCLDVVKGGGIFAIGDVVQPVVKTTPLVPNMPHYNVKLKAIEVGGDTLDVPSDVFDTGSQRGTIIDSGTTLAYLPAEVYQPMMDKIFAEQRGLKIHTVEDQFSCFEFSQSVDDAFPPVVFHFDGSLTLTAYPHDYFFQIRENIWCVGWQNGGLQSRDGTELILLGDLVLSGKLVIYDVANLTIGWTEYNCSSSIKVKDGSGAVYSIGSHNISSALGLKVGKILTLLTTLFAMLHIFCVH